MIAQRLLRVLAVVSRPLAHAFAVEHGGEILEAISPVSLPAVHIVRDELRRAVAGDDIPVQVRFLPWARLAEMQVALAEGYDLIHFAGHGTEDGYLLFEKDDGTADLVGPGRLAQAVGGWKVRLMLLSACFSEAPGRAVQQAGIPNVVMVDGRYPMHAEAAALFNRQFYNLLAHGWPPSEAFDKARDLVRTDHRFGDQADPPCNPETGQVEPHYGQRFRKIIADNRPLVAGQPDGRFEEIHPLAVACNVEADECFVGREVLLIQTIRTLDDGPGTARLVTLTGPGGIGKTSIGRQVALWQADRRRFPQGVTEVRAEGVSNAEELAARFAEALKTGLDPTDVWESVRLNLNGQRLVYLDNADDLHSDAKRGPEGAIGRLAWLLARCPDLRLLVSSRQALVAGGERVIEIDEMNPDEALRLFVAYTPKQAWPALFADGLKTAATICAELDYYPLAITVSAPNLGPVQTGGRGLSLQELLAELRRNMPAALEHVRAQGKPERLKSVRASLDISYQRLTDESVRKLWSRLAAFPGGVAQEMLETLEDEGWPEATAELCFRNLIRERAGRYTLLAPIREYALSKQPAAELEAYRLRAAKWLRDYAQRAAAQFSTITVDKALRETIANETERRLMVDTLSRAGRAALYAESDNLIAAVGWTHQAEQAELLISLVETIEDWLGLERGRGAVEQMQKWALEATRRKGDGVAQTQRLRELGRTRYNQGDMAGAMIYYREALELSQAAKDRLGEANTLKAIGDVQQFRKEIDAALDSYTQALALFRQVGARLGEANTLLALAPFSENAEEMFEIALSLYETIGDRYSIARGLYYLGLHHHRQNQPDKARTVLRQSLEMFEALELPSVAATVRRVLDSVT